MAKKILEKNGEDINKDNTQVSADITNSRTLHTLLIVNDLDKDIKVSTKLTRMEDTDLSDAYTRETQTVEQGERGSVHLNINSWERIGLVFQFSSVPSSGTLTVYRMKSKK